MTRVLLAITALALSFCGGALARGGDAKVAKGTVRAADGVNIVYDVRGQGDIALVFIHGWCCDRTHWRDQADAFAKDYRVVTIDLPGHGESGTNREKWRIPGLAEDVEAVVNALKLKRLILIGHSMGGPVSLMVAKRMPDRVQGVVGVDTLHNVEFKWPEEMAKDFHNKFETDFEGTMRGAVRMMFPEKTKEELVKWVSDRATGSDRKMALGIFGDFPNLDMKKIMAEAKVPIRCVNSAPYSKMSQPTAIDVNRKYADFNAVIMEGVGHYPMLERPQEFNEKLRAVLKELASR